MNRIDPICERVRDRLDAYVGGELEPLEVAMVETHIVACAECADELELARSVSQGLDSLSFRSCPPEAVSRAASRVMPRYVPARRPWWQLMWRPALAGALATVLVLATGYVGQNTPPASRQYTNAELEQARAQAKWALVYIGQVSRKAASTLRKDVIDPNVIAPMRRILDPLKTSKENEHEG